ncbi:DUF4114 domain-containing protein [Lacihabitans soyangensis]|uniref:DUF4114 domain-containing protein n=1 Tax=Lacihabitans soyangensis TaxID=869394 RepID=A0AAE3KR79_9BACT|nr:DUF4114 domain-containing protein [Lacihabitans soyangensis]MCP9761962.1 DUF4114 domain-containing protein [Lacihabitans soyangensis]
MKKKILLFILIFISFRSFSQAYNYMGTYNNQGVPNYLVTPRDVISTSFLNTVNTSLPERYPVPSYNPHYIQNGAQTNIEINGSDSADVWVTFVLEGAGYMNTLGFYTYDLSNPPTTVPNANQINIIFPNVSGLNSGGGLIAGDKVKLGRFAPNTGIGWVLLANAWNPSTRLVGNGLWKLYSNYILNPEANVNLRYHNVLLNEPITNRIILGFEDIRRDNSSCDNDFNDAIFYITATPNTAINLGNINTTTEPGAKISTGNIGGLESNGSLAQQIAKRNVNKELINPKINFDEPKKLTKYNYQIQTSALQEFIPSFGLDSSTSYISTPTDLIQLTNAVDVLSTDYFLASERRAVCLSTKTLTSVYVHTKAICDRVAGASLENTRDININGIYPATLITLKKEEEITEFALSFSFQKLSNNRYRYNSHWNVSDFPSNSEYINFQVWGVKPTEVFYLAEKIIENFQISNTIDTIYLFTPPPSILLKSGYYNQGKINLNIRNNPKTSGLINIWGTYRQSENSPSIVFNDTISLTNALDQTFILNKNGIFDAGFNIQKIGEPKVDAFYLADGAWVENFESNNIRNNTLTVNPHTKINEGNIEKYWIERGIVATGEVKNYFSMHRPLKIGLKPVNLTEFQYLQFTGSGINWLEIVISKESVSQWLEQSRIIVQLDSTTKRFYINMDDFRGSDNQPINRNDINAITFSVISNNVDYIPFDVKLNNIAFTKSGNCDSNQTIAGNSYSKERYESSSTLKVENQNKINARTIYTAANSIEFKTGFIAEPGTVLKAEIRGCQNNN